MNFPAARRYRARIADLQDRNARLIAQRDDARETAAAHAATIRTLARQLQETPLMDIPTPLDARTHAALRNAVHRLRALDTRLAELQAANEAWYRDAHNRTGGPRLDPSQPFGTLPGHPQDPDPTTDEALKEHDQ